MSTGTRTGTSLPHLILWLRAGGGCPCPPHQSCPNTHPMDCSVHGWEAWQGEAEVLPWHLRASLVTAERYRRLFPCSLWACQDAPLAEICGFMISEGWSHSEAAEQAGERMQGALSMALARQGPEEQWLVIPGHRITLAARPREWRLKGAFGSSRDGEGRL